MKNLIRTIWPFILIISLGIIAYLYISQPYQGKKKPPCTNKPENLIFDSGPKESPIYKKHVVQVMSKTPSSEFRYYFVRFKNEANDTIMVVNLRGDGNCFNADFHVHDWSKLAGMYEKKGVSYPEELRGLTWEIQDMGNDKIIVYKDMDHIID